jgi:large subunit ribosomal protein L18
LGKGPRYRVAYRRRREAKTDYKARRVLATSDRPRFVVRRSNKNITIQLVRSKIEGDYVLTQANSSELRRTYGWLGGSKNTPASYLLGMLAGKKALKEGIEEANLDLGLARPTKGSKIFAAVKGALDAGMEIPCDLDVLPDSTRIEGSTIAEYARSLDEPSEYRRLFSGYLEMGLKPEGLPDHFNSVKMKIEEEQNL